MKNILIVEDVQEINDMLKYCLEKDGYQCIQAFSGSEARLLISKQVFDLILLDLMLPGVSGNEILIEVKEKSTIPIIIVSAKDSIETKVEALELGADDYICKPFELEEVLARVHVQLRKKETLGQDNIKLRDIELIPNNYQVLVQEKMVSLTKHEFLILKLLMEFPNRVFTKQNIYEFVWNEEYMGDERVINTHIGNLRAKLRKYSDDEYVQTVWGIGFKFILK